MAKNDNATKLRIETLPTTLTAPQRAEKGRELARKRLEYEDHEDHSKAVRAELKAESDAIQNAISLLARIVNTGKEDQAVEVYDTANVQAKQLETIRTDTGEIVRSRPLTSQELAAAQQGSLFAETTRAASEASKRA